MTHASGHDGPVGTDRERLADVQHVLHGEEGSGSWRSLLYTLYVVALLSGIYGFTVLRGVVEVAHLPARGVSLGPTSGVGALVLGGVVALVVVLALLAHATGRRRGPVTPDLPWLDHVATGPADRRLVLREAWRLPATGLLVGGTLVASVLGAAVWGGGAAGPAAAVTGLAVGVLGSTTVLLAWLAGQLAADDHAGMRTGAALRTAARPGTALRALGLDGLRAHSARSARLGGGVLAGDPRAIRLEAASPVRRGRTWRLRSRGPVRTVLARDLLGLRRQPFLVVGSAVLLLAAGVALGAVVAGRPGNIVPAALCALLFHLGAGPVAEGLRLLGDTLGAPRLLGGSVTREAVAHTAAPAALVLVVAVPAAGVTAGLLAGGVAAATAALVTASVGAVVLGSQWLAAFRVMPPSFAFLPDVGPQVLLAWLAVPLLVSAGAGVVVVQTLLAATAGVPLAAASAALAVVVVWLRAHGVLGRASSAHRD
ncbi:hypothetical protein [Phycicoccus jejuensis]|uniref:hypothetical protein n=1 Tax=Phycicoccus jejuensis TaxID=367299 RepID=UPI00055C6A89|nr:hypothetical protein [Phycicoccus jejuensis]